MTAMLGHTLAKAFLPVWCHRILEDRGQRVFLWGNVVRVSCSLHNLIIVTKQSFLKYVFYIFPVLSSRVAEFVA